MTVDQALQLAFQHHQAGRLLDAEGLYHQILAVQPRHADALHLAGLVAHQTGRHDLAVKMIFKAVAVSPMMPAFHLNLGAAYQKLGSFDKAIAAYGRALRINPGYAEAHNNLGNALKEKGRLHEAIESYRCALRHKPDHAEAHNNMGAALAGEGARVEAIAAYRRALQIKADYAEAHNNLGVALAEDGRLNEAVDAYRSALHFKPEYAEAHNNLGNALREQGQFGEAMSAYQRALQLRPTYAEAHNNLGVALTDKSQLGEAIASFGRAIQIMPDYAMAHNNLGNALKDGGQLVEAVAAYRSALRFKPDDAVAHSNLLLALHYLPGADVKALFDEHRRWDEVHARPLEKAIKPHGKDRGPERRLRIGYVSPDFRSQLSQFLTPLLEAHDHTQFEVHCYSSVKRPDLITERLKKCADVWRDVLGVSDEKVAEQIREDGIDILVDLTQHVANNRLLAFARKPAPVQVAWLGYPNTTGMSAMDYRFTDAHADPPGSTEHLHSEQLVRLPESAWCCRAAADAPPVNTLPCERTGRVTFGCFNVHQKTNEPLLALWAEILKQTPGSRLLLKNHSLGDASVQERTRVLLEKCGIEPGRVELALWAATAAGHLAEYGRVDIALDTFPYHGTVTTCEALWMGVPVVTLAGRTHVSRVGVSLLRNAGLPELIAESDEEYIRIAVKLAGEISRLAELRATLRARMAASPLMDGPRFARDVEHAYREMWRAWCAKQCSHPPA